MSDTFIPEKFVMIPAQAAQLDRAFLKAGFTPSDVHKLCDLKVAEQVLIYVRGRAKLTKVSFLNSVGSTILPAVKKPPVLIAGDGIYFWPNAEALFQNVESSPLPKMKVAYGDLTEERNDFQNIEEIGNKSIFEVEEMSCQLARLLKKQAGGKKGVLLNDGKANIFYVRNPENPELVLFVNVRWDGDAQKWLVRANPASTFVWRVGGRVFRKCGSLVA